MFYKIKHFIAKIHKIIKYIPIIWRDEDYDYEYMLEIMRIKLQDLKSTLNKNNILSGKQLEAVNESITKVLSHIENYCNSYENYCNLHGELPLQPEDFDESLQVNGEEKQKQLKDYYNGFTQFEEEHWNAIFDTIKQHGRTWWD